MNLTINPSEQDLLIRILKAEQGAGIEALVDQMHVADLIEKLNAVTIIEPWFGTDRYTDIEREDMTFSIREEISDDIKSFAVQYLEGMSKQELDGYVINLELFENLLPWVVDGKLALDNAYLDEQPLDFARMLELGIFTKDDPIYAKLTDHGRAVAAEYSLIGEE